MTETPKESDVATDIEGALSLSESSSNSRWAFINGWQVEPQSNDRAPAIGEVAPSTAPPAARRSTTRRKHQVMFKQWSQNRHD